MPEATIPSFAQSVDIFRPHTLLTDNPKFSGSLVYRYDDTGDTVSVTNIWYNQPYPMRVAAIRWEADRQEEHARRMECSPPFPLSKDAAANIARRYRERATRIRSEANRMQAAGRDTHPVAASHLVLDYGPPVD